MFVSVIIPTRKINDYIRKEIIPALQKQSFPDFELIIVADKYEKQEQFPSFVSVLPSWPKTSPGDKRDLAVSQAKGDIVAFIDDDAYPDKNWLKNALEILNYHLPPTTHHQPPTTHHEPDIAAVCGPGITPPTDGLAEKVSSWVWGSTLGAGGIGTHRCRPEKKRELDDFPTFNLIVKKSDFEKVGGFNTHFWPGEDTKLCYKLVYELGKKIVYDPKILVYHHRRAVFVPHLKQIAGYGLHRGHFARVLPKTSRRVRYFLPSFLVLWLFFFPILFWGFREFGGILTFYTMPLALYFSLLLATAIRVYRGERNFRGSLLLIPAIFSTHIVYGLMFVKGFLSRKLRE
ncbi:MAG: glycosyltransferase [Candidatus Cloacimonetes bacterium]|nr:glycosyltransferase [Candidatus Cloacimonadota bacterium]